MNKPSVFPRNFVLALVAAVAVTPVAMPVRALAQRHTPDNPLRLAERSRDQAAIPTQPNESLPALPGQVKQEEHEENDVFRHTPLVKKLAHAFNLDVETTARLFEWINFAIIMLVIILPIAKFLPRILRKREETLKKNLETARKTTADANARLSAVEAKLARLDDEIARIHAQVEEESKRDEEHIKASLQEESARIFAAAEQEIAAAAAHAQRSLRHFAADLAIEQAAQRLVLTPESDRALIDEFVREANQGGAKGARN